MYIKLNNYDFVIPDGKSVVVFANYRTGSTALCDLLSKQLGIDNIDETFHFKNRRATQFNDEYYQKKPVIIKVMPDQKIPEPFKDEILDNFYHIGLYRRDLIKQTISFGVSRRTLDWHQIKDDPEVEKYKDLRLGHHAFVSLNDMICKYHKIYNGFRQYLDIEMTYEGLGNDLHNSKYVPMPKHNSYEQWIKDLTQHLTNNGKPITNE